MRNGAICPVLHAKTQGRTLVSNTRCDAYACVSNTYTLDEEKIPQEISGLLMRRKSWVQVRKLGPSAVNSIQERFAGHEAWERDKERRGQLPISQRGCK